MTREPRALNGIALLWLLLLLLLLRLLLLLLFGPC